MNERIQEGNERKNRKTRGGEDKKKPLEREGDERANTGRTNQRKKKTRGRVKQRKGIVESPSKLQQLGASSSQHRTTQEQKNTDDTDTEKKGRKPENMTSNTRIPSRH
jgi:hypothetical protein